MTSSFDAQINYEPNNNCTDLTTNHPALTTNICPFVLLLKSLYWYNFVHNMVIGHCIGNVKSMVLQMNIFNTDFAHICYVTPWNNNEIVMYTYCCDFNTRPPI